MEHRVTASLFVQSKHCSEVFNAAKFRCAVKETVGSDSQRTAWLTAGTVSGGTREVCKLCIGAAIRVNFEDRAKSTCSASQRYAVKNIVSVASQSGHGVGPITGAPENTKVAVTTPVGVDAEHHSGAVQPAIRTGAKQHSVSALNKSRVRMSSIAGSRSETAQIGKPSACRQQFEDGA